MITHINTVSVYVDDQNRAAQFWTRDVGFEERRRTPMGPGVSWLEVAPRGAPSSLVLYPKAMMPDWPQHKPSIVFRCQDIDGVCAGLKARGVHFAKELEAMPWGKFASFLDLDGNEFGLSEG